MTADAQREVELWRSRYERERRIRQAAERIGEDRTAQLYQADQLKTMFLETVSHELRTPLTSILGFSSALDVGWDQLSDERRRDYLGRLRRNAEVLARLIDELLEFEQGGNPAPATASTVLDLSTLVTDAIAQVADVLADHQLDAQIEPGLEATAEPIAVQRIVANLLTNSSRYAPPGTPIVVSLRAEEQRCVLTVDDAGPGVPEAERHLVFERFFRGSSPETMRVRGTGIGLAVVKDLVTALGGSISVTDAPGGGARFELVLRAP